MTRGAPPEPTGSDVGDAASTRRFAVRDLCRGAQVAPGLTLEEEVGRGGCGVVWSARWLLPSGIEKRVALKRVNADAGDVEEQAHRLSDEARLLARISHRAIVRMEDVLMVGGAPAILTEYVDGADLGVLLDRGPLPPRVAAEAMAELASALEAAHSGVPDGAGAMVPLVHRDIKPANVRLTRWGEIKLLDFGAAQAAVGDRESATRGFVLGSPGYLAPEALMVGAGAPGDIFALGVLAWECRMGERLGRLSSQRRLHGEQAERAAARLPEAGWAQLVTRLLAWEVVARPTAGEARRALEALACNGAGPSLREWARDVLPATPLTEAARIETTCVEAPSIEIASIDIAPIDIAPIETASREDGAGWPEEPDQTQTQVEILAPPGGAGVARHPARMAPTAFPVRRRDLPIVLIGAALGLVGGGLVVLVGLLLVLAALTSG